MTGTAFPHQAARAPGLGRTERLLALAPPGVDLAYSMPSGDWTEPGSREKLARHVAKVAKWPMNGTFSIASLASNIDFEIGYSGCAPMWRKRGSSSELRVTFARERIYAAPDAIETLLGPRTRRPFATTTCAQCRDAAARISLGAACGSTELETAAK